MSEHPTTPCESCGAPMIWATTNLAGKAIPLDAEPERRFIIEKRGGKLVAHNVKTYTTHFATCPNADKHRRPR